MPACTAGSTVRGDAASVRSAAGTMVVEACMLPSYSKQMRSGDGKGARSTSVDTVQCTSMKPAFLLKFVPGSTIGGASPVLGSSLEPNLRNKMRVPVEDPELASGPIPQQTYQQVSSRPAEPRAPSTRSRGSACAAGCVRLREPESKGTKLEQG